MRQLNLRKFQCRAFIKWFCFFLGFFFLATLLITSRDEDSLAAMGELVQPKPKMIKLPSVSRIVEPDQIHTTPKDAISHVDPSPVVLAKTPFAYCTLLHTEIGNKKEGYIASVLVMAASLRLSRCQHPLVVLVAGPKSEYVDKALASCANCIPRPVESISLPANMQLGGIWTKDKWSKAFNKLWIWTLTEYERVLWMDADIFPAENIDHMFEMKVARDIIMSRNWCGPCCKRNPGDHEFGNSGIMMIKPKEETFNMLKDRIRYDGRPDQQMIQSVLKYEVFPDQYGAYTTESLQSCCDHAKTMFVADGEAKIVHNIDKPWNMPVKPVNGSYEQGFVALKRTCGAKLLQAWFRLYDGYVKDYVKIGV